jgi:Na+-transporting NADH:ubiquinone oxidoreductase subunit NqrB
VFDQGVEINILNDAVVGRAVAFFTEPFGLSHIDPIGSLIRGSLEAALIDEGFEQA